VLLLGLSVEPIEHPQLLARRRAEGLEPPEAEREQGREDHATGGGDDNRSFCRSQREHSLPWPEGQAASPATTSSHQVDEYDLSARAPHQGLLRIRRLLRSNLRIYNVDKRVKAYNDGNTPLAGANVPADRMPLRRGISV